MSNHIKELFPEAVVVGNSSPPRSGSFEVTIEGKLVYSKFKTGTFPNTEEINKWF